MRDVSHFLGFFSACWVMCMVFREHLVQLWGFLGGFEGLIGLYVVFVVVFLGRFCAGFLESSGFLLWGEGVGVKV